MKNKTKAILWLIATFVLTAVFTILIIGGASTNNDDLVVFGVFAAIFIVPFFAWQTISLFVKGKKVTVPNKSLLSNNDKKLLTTYKNLKEEDYNEVGFVFFVNEGIKFSAEAKYGCKKNFNGKQGYHLAFNIKGKKLVDKPEQYDDIVDYSGHLFNIELGYFDGILLSTPENDNGIIVQSQNLEGKTIDISQLAGYTASITTAESDDIDVGQIKFVQWNKDAKIIKFKLVVGAGLCDVVVGTVKLVEEKE